MKLQFYGAAGCVTGSCHLIKVNEKNVLVDCGLYQGKDEKERGNEDFDFNPKEIDFVILTHAHIDHSGRIPLLYKRGFKGEVICTEATRDLCSVMLPDSGHIMEMETEWKNRKRIRQGLEPIEPLYTAKIAELSIYLFRSCEYDKWIELFEGFKIRFKDAGHLLGSSSVEIKIKDKDKGEVKLVYSGDLGNKNLPLIKDPSKIDYADYVIMETTYGDRLHDNINDEFGQLVNIIKTTFKRGGNVIIPSFAVGRTQEVLYVINKYVENDTLKNLTVYVDSPLASESTKIFQKYSNIFDEEAKKLIDKGDNPLDFEGLIFTSSPEDSARINKIQSGALIISASGMCEAGRIKHHLKHNLWRKECSIVFVGYQAEGTLGRAIISGAKKVKIFGEEIAVNAEIHVLQGLSGHADRNGLLEWVEGFKKKPKEILLVHGDSEVQDSFKNLLESKGFNARIMKYGERYIINKYDGKATVDVKEKIIKLLDSLKDIDEMDKEILLQKIKKVLEE
ncbi:MBL fold metallo-hydrolase [Clostridium sp. SYSU_GA19001]|uniref:MBL fold metallo-hydrolase RNA specificity domain-containing protein n=1 Tax=Clostridium caldaquaticum TaxID=2940653 RepID=UPI0020777589|nr:MBL fold metallo-hydrolase [Clostridium caldaquaticum]MCM8711723.1 MBL fold metallo-hydrolase [Clostridium caldaquaticum]